MQYIPDFEKCFGKLPSGQPVYDRTDSHLQQHPEVLPFIQEALTKINYEGKEWFGGEVDLGSTVGVTTCVETSPEDLVFYAMRKGRVGFTRFAIGREPVETQFVTVYLRWLPEHECCIVLTAFIGSAAPFEPWHTEADEAAFKFWTEEKALIWEQGTTVPGTEQFKVPFFFRKLRPVWMRESLVLWRRWFPVG